MIGLDGKESHRFFHSRQSFVASVLGLCAQPHVVLAAWASYYKYWLYKIAHWWAQFGGYFRNGGALAKYRFRRWKPGAGTRGPKTWCWDLKLTHLSMRTANNKGFECYQLEGGFFFYHLTEKNEIERLQLCFFCPDNILFENDSKKALEPNGPSKNSGSSYPWIVKDYCDQWE